MSGIDLSGVSVAIIMVVRDYRDITVPTTDSLIRSIMLLGEYGVPFETHFHVGGDLEGSRSWSVQRFLQTDRTHAFLLDSDIVWQPQDFMKLLAYATDYEVIGAGYRAKRDPPFYLVHLSESGVRADNRGCIPVSGMGLGFTCIQRKVFEQLSAKARMTLRAQHSPDPFPEVFRFDRVGIGFRGEDMTFLEDVRALGYTPRLDPSIELGHIGVKEFTGRVADQLHRAQVAAE